MATTLPTTTATAPIDPAPLLADAGLERDADGVLRMGAVSLDAIARDVGTPAYLYHAAVIRDRFRSLDQAFGDLPHEIHFAVKSNASLAVLNLLKELGSGADIVSGGELRRALRVGIPPRKIVFSGVGKTEQELEAAVGARIGSINIETADELTVLERIVGRRSVEFPVRLGIRVNPDVAADTHPYITTGASGIKFGVPVEQVVGLARRIAGNPRLSLVTIAMHLGSQLLEAGPFGRGAVRLLQLIDDVRAAGVRTIEAVDIGGGLGIRYRDETPLEPAALAAVVRPLVAGRDLLVHLEPGRYLTGSAGVLLAKVLYRKRSGGKDFVIVDASMTDLVRPSHYQAHHEIVEVSARGRGPRVVDVVGPVCETGDFLALDRTMPDVESGEYLAILCAGAYGAVMSSNYNSRPRAPEVIVDHGRYAVARARETVEDLYRGETADPFRT
ncbi:MAG: diaminopimelate decarboxylase [Gemmatimonadales bacterium]|nr:diaminopimelate decarboxylase [Gemmatimonadales bacterium]